MIANKMCCFCCIASPYVYTYTERRLLTFSCINYIIFLCVIFAKLLASGKFAGEQ